MIDSDKNEVSTYYEACMSFLHGLEWMCNQDTDLLMEYAKWKNEDIINFYRTDTDHDGQVSRAELTSWDWPESHIDQIMSNYDMNNDG